MKYKERKKRHKRARIQTLSFFLLLALPLLVGAQGKIAQNSKQIANDSILGSTSYNTQTLALLDPSGGVFSSARGGADVEIVDVTALKSTQGTSVVGSDKIAAKKSGNVSLYTVREGDSIGLIAEMFGVTTNTIIWANDIKNSTIRPGERLIILPMSGVRHRVKEGDTIASIAKKYNGDEDEIREFNDVAEDTSLAVGAFINIPDGEVAETISSSRQVVTQSSSLIRPISGGVKTQGIHGYNAVDLAAPEGTSVFASASGTVITARANGAWNGGYGNYVIIKHPNGVQTLYAHFGSVLVGAGQEVVQGQTIGYIGMTGKTTGPHVHFEVRGATNPF